MWSSDSIVFARLPGNVTDRCVGAASPKNDCPGHRFGYLSYWKVKPPRCARTDQLCARWAIRARKVSPRPSRARVLAGTCRGSGAMVGVAGRPAPPFIGRGATLRGPAHFATGTCWRTGVPTRCPYFGPRTATSEGFRGSARAPDARGWVWALMRWRGTIAVARHQVERRRRRRRRIRGAVRLLGSSQCMWCSRLV